MKIYTKGGDQGETGLFGGERVPKHAPRIDAYGEIDELNGVLGWCSAVGTAEFKERLEREQGHLFTLGAHLATPPSAPAASKDHLPKWPKGATAQLEQEIDAWEETLSPLKTFILPGGDESACRLHIARSVARRAERAVGILAEQSEVAPDHLAYLNRLSDWLFVFARAANKAAGQADIPWEPRRDS